MKSAKKSLALLLCVIMLATSVITEGTILLPQSLKAQAMKGHEQNYNDARLELNFNKDWSFALTEDEAAYMKGFDDSDWESVDLPHDFSMSQDFSVTDTEAESGNLPGGTGWYRKWFNLYDYYTGEHIFLNFDGAYQHTYVYVNGRYVGENHYGYNSFSFEISEYLICSNTALNLIAVKVVNEIPSSRWYSGTGINRDVSLTIAGPVHISLYGPQVTTPDVQNGGGTAEASITMHNDTAITKKITVEATILDSNHNPVSDTVVSSLVTVPAHTEQTVVLKPEVKSPKLWSPDDPNLYKLKTIIKGEDGEIIDEYHTTFGYRYINWDADKGFSLNGEYMKLKGVCMHHDQGALGAAQEYDAIYRQIVILKEMGCNAIRTSHNSTSRILIDICNELGMLVMEEFFDGWDASKNSNNHDFSEYFHETVSSSTKLVGAHDQEWYEFVVEQTILRDRHDPCVIAWDVGNELCGITSGESTANYQSITTSIVAIADRLDPSRVLLQGNDGPNNSVNTMIDGYMDVIGGNYNLNTWVSIMNGTSDSRTNKPFVATESASAINSRGVYDTTSYYNYQCTSYDTNAVSWGNEAAEAWNAVVKNDWFSGEFVWTGFDYIGEPTPWNNVGASNTNAVPNSSYFGIVDTAGFAKDSYYLYRSWWNDESTTLHLVPGSWNQSELLLNNGYTNVAVYSNAKKVELLLNGSVIATATSTTVTTPAGYKYQTWTESITDSSKCAVGSFYTGDGAELYPQFSVKYAAGTLEVRAYDENNNLITDTVGSTKSVTGNATQIAVKTWQNKDTFVADSDGFIYVEFEAQDADGNFMNDYNGTLSVKVDDASARYAKIVGVDNGNAATTEKYQQSSVIISGAQATINMFNGRALVILRTTEEEGTINVTAVATDNSGSFSTEGLTVTSITESGIELTDELEEVIVQSGDEYTPTLYDKYEMIKYRIQNINIPNDSGSSGGSGDSGDYGDSGDSGETETPTDSDRYTIYLSGTPNASSQCIADGDYVIYNMDYVMTSTQYGSWGMSAVNTFEETVDAPAGAAYTYESFKTGPENVFTFTHQGNNTYYIRNKSTGNYVYFGTSQGYLTYSTTPKAVTVHVNDNGSVLIYTDSMFLYHYYYYFYSNGTNKETASTKTNNVMWLYSSSGGSTTQPEPTPTPSGKYTPYTPNASIEDGNYAILNSSNAMSSVKNGYTGINVTSVTDIDAAPSGSAYPYAAFELDDSNAFVFESAENGGYYIKNESWVNGSGTGYLYMDSSGYLYSYSTWKSVFYPTYNADGSVYLKSDTGFYISKRNNTTYFAGSSTADDTAKIWLYSRSATEVVADKYSKYTPSSNANAPIENDNYVIINNANALSSIKYSDYRGMYVSSVTDIESAPSGAAYPYERFDSDDSNVFVFESQGNGAYYIKNKATGNYLFMDTTGLLYTFTGWQSLFYVTVNSDGSVYLRSDSGYFIANKSNSDGTQYISGSSTADDSAKIWLYSKNAAGNGGGTGGSVSTERTALYNALLDGIEIDYSTHTRASYETLLTAMDEGIDICENPDATNDEIVAAKQAILDAIAALEMDIKKIGGTLFKYGYDNTNGKNYSSGGALINNISLEQMKAAILADANLVNQIKTLIDYDGANTTWEAGYADAALEAVAMAYARIYTLQFTGAPVNGGTDSPASITPDLSTSSRVPVSPWNVWTKENTQGVNDSKDEGASVQGLASATLNNGVVTSHSAYTDPLSYANDGSGSPNDITYYTYTFNTGASSTKNVRLEYLSGISVYFPDLFSRENLDANGNVTTATTGNFSKYYWDAQFPMFISTDEYGVNTYHFDSSNTKYLVQSSFDDENQRVDMELSEVGSWSANGSLSGSGFFPFNYQQGTTSYSGENAIYHYGFTFEHSFYIPKGGKHVNGEDVVFNFSGDDDVLVYIDGVLVLDNGGLHGARAATIDFTTCSINYQYAMDVVDGQLKGDEYETTYSYNTYIENPDASGYNADTIAAINKLHEIISDGQVHTLNFYYLERGSTDSNCKISFNLSETSEDVKIIDQTLTLDYGLPVEYNITENDKISQAAIDNGATVEYLGLCAINEDYSPTYTFEVPQIIVPFEEGVTYNIEGMKYGECTIDKEGNVSYNLKSMNMSESEYFYVVARITGDPTYADEVVYYQVEKTTFVPATAIYYEDTYDTITYTNGKVPSNYDNTANQYGIWQTKGMQSTTLKQTADITDSEANPYGYETNYMSFAEYSGGSTHYVDVSTKNNPSSKYSGGTGAAWPTAGFTFTGTGFDLISITDSTTGAFSVAIKNSAGKTVKNTVVDTFYGYNYGQIYMDANGKPTLDSSFTTMYKSETGMCTSAVRYYDVNGAITATPHYYDADGNVVETETDNPAYAYAYGWVVAEEGSGETLYQIPVIKITGLAYDTYSVTITPTFTSAFGHASTAADGTKYYSIYLDAIKIYSPAGEGDDIKDKEVKDAYATDDELYPDYLELKNMLIGADKLSETDTQGIIFIDGIAALDNDIGTYKNAGPNNELYLAKDQAVAFEIWATSVPTDIQLGAKLACGNPKLTISYDSKTTDINIGTATDIYYSLNTELPHDGKLTWRQVDGSDGNKYYTTGTVVIQNTGDEDSVLSITNLKWTFSQTGGKGYFRIPTPIENEVVTLASTSGTTQAAYSLMRMRTAALDVEQTEAPRVVTDESGNSTITMTLQTSADVDALSVTDKNGNPVDSQSLDITSDTVDDETMEWTVKITVTDEGEYTFLIAGVYENGYVDSSKAQEVSVTVEKPADDETPDEPDIPEDDTEDDTTGDVIDPTMGILDTIIQIIREIIEILKSIFSSTGINV